MPERPVYVAVIGWVLIVIGLLSILSVAAGLAMPSVRAALEAGPLPLAAKVVINLGSSVFELACGFYILRGANWARLAYLALCAVSTLYLLTGGAINPSFLLLWAVIVVATLVGLFTPAASRFFAGTAATSVDEASA